MRSKNYFSILDTRTRSVGYYSLVLFIVLLLLAPLIIGNMEQGPYIMNVLILCMLWASLAQSWNMIFGNVGLFIFGHQVFFGIGGYVSALFALNFYVSPWLGMLIGGCSAALVGIIVCIPCLKLRHTPFICIATMCLGEIGKLLATNLVGITRGELGLWKINNFDNVLFFNFQGNDKTSYFYLMLIIFIVIGFVAYRMKKSSLGLAMSGIRDSQDAADSLGVNVVMTKLKTFMIGAFFAGIVGAFYAHYFKILTPNGVLGDNITAEIIVMNLLGGMGTVAGPIVGAFSVTILMEWLRFLGDYRMLIYGILVIILTMFMPSGVVGRYKNRIIKLIQNNYNRVKVKKGISKIQKENLS